MSEDIKVCVNCKTGATLRVSLSQSEYQKQTDHLSGFNELELKYVYYHSEFRKPIVKKID